MGIRLGYAFYPGRERRSVDSWCLLLQSVGTLTQNKPPLLFHGPPGQFGSISCAFKTHFTGILRVSIVILIIILCVGTLTPDP